MNIDVRTFARFGTALAAAASVALSSSAAVAAPPSLADFAGYAGDAYAFTREPRWAPKAGCTVVHQVRRTETSGFQGIALACGGNLVVSFTGSKFIEKDEMDAAADKALVKISLFTVLELPSLLAAQHDLARAGWRARPGSHRFTFECLAAKMHEAEAFFAAATEKSRIAKGASFVVGHSLGGFLAEYVGAQHGVTAHAFNPGPGARHIVSPSSSGGASVTVHHRDYDAVSGAPFTVGAHVGRRCAYAGAGQGVRQLDQNEAHSIATFAKDLAAGLRPIRCE